MNICDIIVILLINTIQFWVKYWACLHLCMLADHSLLASLVQLVTPSSTALRHVVNKISSTHLMTTVTLPGAPRWQRTWPAQGSLAVCHSPMPQVGVRWHLCLYSCRLCH